MSKVHTLIGTRTPCDRIRYSCKRFAYGDFIDKEKLFRHLLCLTWGTKTLITRYLFSPVTVPTSGQFLHHDQENKMNKVLSLAEDGGR